MRYISGCILFFVLSFSWHVAMVDAESGRRGDKLSRSHSTPLAEDEKAVGVGNFFGRWFSPDLDATYTFKPGGKWESLSRDGKYKTRGRWKVEMGTMVWRYDREPSAPDDVYIILSVTENSFVLKKQGGSEASFTRIK